MQDLKLSLKIVLPHFDTMFLNHIILKNSFPQMFFVLLFFPHLYT